MTEGSVIDKSISILDIYRERRYNTSMNYLRLERVIAHLERHAHRSTYYKGLLRQYELLGHLSAKQIASVEGSIAQDNTRAQAQAKREIREWNLTH